MSSYQKVFEYPEQLLIELYHWLNPQLQSILDQALENQDQYNVNEIIMKFAENIILYEEIEKIKRWKWNPIYLQTNGSVYLELVLI